MLSALVALVGSLPVAIRASIGALCGALFGLLPLRDRRIAELQLARFLDVSSPRRTAIGVYAEAGKTALTAINLKPLLGRVHCADGDFVDSLKTLGRPVLALTAHLGVWDLLGAFAVSRGLAVATIGRAARSPKLHTSLASIRAGYGITTIWREDPHGVRAILKHFKGNGLIAALIDQDTRVAGTFSDFFGVPAFTPSSLIDIARRNDALIVTAFIVRRDDGIHEVSVQPIPDSAPLNEVLATYHARLESLIRRHPTQWVWFHKRWRTLGTGERLSSAAYERFLRTELGAHSDFSKRNHDGRLGV